MVCLFLLILVLRNGLDTRTQDALFALNKTIAMTVMGMDGGRNTYLGCFISFGFVWQNLGCYFCRSAFHIESVEL